MSSKMSIKEAMEKSETIKMFDNPLLERLSHVHPLTPFVIYIPAISIAIGYAAIQQKLPVLNIALYFLAGVAIWSLAEYVLHRFLFHIPRKSRIAETIYFYTHGIHHDAPNDATRLVMPPGASIPIATGVFFGAQALFSIHYLPVFAGFVAGYLYYDWLHFATHFYAFRNNYFRKVKKAHMIHHYTNNNSNFGFTTPIWDHVFGTVHKSKVEETAEELAENGKPL